MAEEKKKMSGGAIAAICIGVVAVIAAIVAVIVINVTRPNIVGKYSLYAMIDSEGNESTQSAEFMKSLGATYTIEFKNDKTGILEMGVSSDSLAGAFVDNENNDGSTGTSASTEFTYENGKIKGENSLGSFEASYTFKDDTVDLTISGETMRFKRDTKK